MIAPDILSLCLPLSLVTLVLGFLTGLLLWVLGGMGHRFCIVLATTLIAGVVGLQTGPTFGMQPLVAGLLLAVAIGALALSLVRVAVFLGVGFGFLTVAQTLIPRWDEPLACFVAGGVLGVVFFRFWIQAVASMVGTLLMSYAGLALVARLAKTDVTAWAEKNGPLLNWGVLSVAVLGILVQILVQKRGLWLRKGKGKSSKGDAKPDSKPASAPPPPPPPPPAAPPPPPPRPFWLRWLPQGAQKKAG
jgi:MFS family permease